MGFGDMRIGGAGGGSDKGGGAGAVVLAGVVALGLVGGGVGATGLGGAAGTGAGGQGVSVRKLDGRKDAKRGDAEAAWRRFGMRGLKRAAKQQSECAASSFGEVREFFLAHRCTSMEKTLLLVGDDAGNSAVISVVWVGFGRRGDASAFRTLIDEHGTGDVTPMGGAVLGLGGIAFAGHNYGSDRDGNRVTVAEAETASGHVGADVLDALAEVAAYLPPG